MERSAAYIEISQRPDGHASLRVVEGDNERDVDLGFMPIGDLRWIVIRDLHKILRKAFWAGYSHASYRAAEWHSKQPAWLKRKLK